MIILVIETLIFSIIGIYLIYGKGSWMVAGMAKHEFKIIEMIKRGNHYFWGGEKVWEGL